MSGDIGEFNITVPGGESKRLKTGGKYCPADIVVTAAGGGGVTSWNDLTDKPFGSEVTEGVIKWDGDSSGKEVLDLVGDHQHTLAKVSNDTFTMDELTGCTMVVYTNGVGETELTIGQENAPAAQLVEGLVTVMLGQIPFVLTVVDDGVYAGMPMKKGTYFGVTVDEAEVIEYVKSISCLTGEVETTKTIDEKYLPDSVKGGGGVTSWNDLADKPFGEEIVVGDTLTWDGNTEGLVNLQGVLFKVADAPDISIGDFSNGAKFSFSGEERYVPVETITELATGVIDVGNVAVFVFEKGVGVDFGIGAVTEPGVYFVKEGDDYVESLTIPGYTGFTTTTIKPLDEKYLPDSVNNIVVASMSASTMKLSHTPAEIDTMQSKGKMVLCSVTGATLSCATINGIATASSVDVQHVGDRLRMRVFNFDKDGLFTGVDEYLLTATKQ